MKSFYELSENGKTVLLALIFLLNLCQYGYFLMQFHYREKKGRAVNLTAALLVFMSMPFLAVSIQAPGTAGISAAIPAAAVFLIWLVLFVYTLRNMISLTRRGHRMLTSQSVKAALDQLPDGLACFSANGLLTLSNVKMQELFFRMTGENLQMLRELETVLQSQCERQADRAEDGEGGESGESGGTERIVRLPDDTVWKFSRREIQLQSQRSYIQYLAVNVTDLYQLREKTVQDNRKMQAVIRQVRNITENAADITRQEEILAARMRVHNKMGSCMLALRRYLTVDLSHSEKEKEQLIRLWEENLSEMQYEPDTDTTADAYADVVRIAKNLGLEVILHGSLPADRETVYLLTAALRECTTNALKHAKADRLELTVQNSERETRAYFANNGLVPFGDIREGGGLSSLRTKIESAGGQMEVTGKPAFQLTIILPAPERLTGINLP